MYKDFGLILAAAQLHLAMPVTEAEVVIDDAEALSGREGNFSAGIRRMEQEAGGEKES